MPNRPVLHLVDEAENRLARALRKFNPPFFPNDRESIRDSCHAFEDRLRALQLGSRAIDRRRLKVLCNVYEAETAVALDIDLALEGPQEIDKEADVSESLGLHHASASARGTFPSKPTAQTAQAMPENDRKNPTKKVRVLFPNRSLWLKYRLRERGWNKHDLHRHRGPDRKTVQKILDGKCVREDVLEKLAAALSDVSDLKKLPKVGLLDIPQD